MDIWTRGIAACACLCAFTCTYACAYMCMCICTYICTSMCKYMCIYMCMFLCTLMSMSNFMSMSIYTSNFICMCKQMHVHENMRVHEHVYMSMCVKCTVPCTEHILATYRNSQKTIKLGLRYIWVVNKAFVSVIQHSGSVMSHVVRFSNISFPCKLHWIPHKRFMWSKYKILFFF